MRKTTIADAGAIAVFLLASPACAPAHRVSPWGEAGLPPLAAFVARADLDARLEAIDSETSHLGLKLTAELRGALPDAGGVVVVRAYEGVDAIGRKTHAVRIATPHAVVMALGPLESTDRDRDQATELIPALVMTPGGNLEGAALRAGTDLNGDRAPDVVLRSEEGTLQIWRISRIGSSRHDVVLEARPTRIEDADGDGRVDLLGEANVPGGDPIGAKLLDIATFDGMGYTNKTDAARAYHEKILETLSGSPASNGLTGDAGRLKRALERAWHAIRAGESSKNVLLVLDREPVPEPLREAFRASRRRLETLGSGRR